MEDDSWSKRANILIFVFQCCLVMLDYRLEVLQTILDSIDRSPELVWNTCEHHFGSLVYDVLLLQMLFGWHILKAKHELVVLSRLRVHLEALHDQIVVKKSVCVSILSHLPSRLRLLIKVVIFILIIYTTYCFTTINYL